MSTNQNFWWQRRAKADWNRGPSGYQPNALPLGQTGSRRAQLTTHGYIRANNLHSSCRLDSQCSGDREEEDNLSVLAGVNCYVVTNAKLRRISFISVKQLFVRCVGKKKKKGIFAERLHSLAVSYFIRCCFSTFCEVCSVNRSIVSAVKGNLSVDFWYILTQWQRHEICCRAAVITLRHFLLHRIWRKRTPADFVAVPCVRYDITRTC